MRQNREQIIGWTRSGCIVTDTALASCSEDRSVDRNSAWITALGILLGVVSVLICAAIVVLWIQDTRIAYTNRQQLHQRRILKQHAAVVARVAANASSGSAGKNGDLRRVPSDMVTLIPSNGGATTTVDKKRVRFNS
jgi:signal transduction histidine kinase